MRRIQSIAVVALLALAACSNPTAPTHAAVTGSWSGQAENYTLDLSLTESVSGVSGSGSISYPGTASSTPLVVSGVDSAQNVGLWLTTPDSITAVYAGKVVSPTEIHGTLWPCTDLGQCIAPYAANPFDLTLTKGG